MRPRLWLVTLALATWATTAHAGDAMEEIRRLDREISVATWAGDEMWFEENLAEDYILITPAATVRNKRDVIRELATPGLKMEPFEPSDVQIRIYGDAAVVTGRMVQKFTLGGIRYANDLRYTDIYVRRKGRWLLASGHTSAVAPRR